MSSAHPASAQALIQDVLPQYIDWSMPLKSLRAGGPLKVSIQILLSID
jgi:hypothetical protein